MPPSTTTTARSTRRSTPAPTVTVARVLLVVLGAVGLAGALYFTFVAPPGAGGAVSALDRFLGTWKIAVSLGFVAVALAPMSRAGRLRVATWLAVADLAFGIAKVVGYDERESWLFLAMTLLLLGLLLVARRRPSVG